jgi:hypothetical protein
MKMNYNNISKYFSLLFFVLFFNTVMAQSKNEAPLVLVARSYENKILVRYFPTSSTLLAKANKNGYIVERSVKNNGVNNDKLSYKPITILPIKKWDDKQWEEEFNKRSNLDSNELKLAGLAMALSMPAEAKQVNVLENDLKSLKQIQTENENKFSYLLLATSGSLFAAEGLGMLAIDDKVSLGTNYVYRVRINSTETANDWVYVEVKCQAFNASYLKPKIKTNLFEGDESVNFSFTKHVDYYAYTIERSADAGKTFKKLNDKLEIKLSPTDYEGENDNAYLDSNLINYKKYTYRIFGATIFADEILLAEFEAMPKDRTPPPAPFLKFAKQIKPKEVELVWEMPEQKTRDLKGFIIKRGFADDSVNITISKNILPIAARSYIDVGFDVEAQNYYKVLAVDTAGNVSYSFPILALVIDSIPPSTPLVKSAIIDSLGKVIITLVPNTEKDFMGYQLLKANAAEHEFSVVNQTFNDSAYEKIFVVYDSTTLNTLTKNIYYKLIAFDTHFNQSQESKIIQLKRRDTIPPISPVITDYLISDSSILLYFAPSSSDDVSQNILVRRINETEKFDTIWRSFNNTISFYKDNKINPATSYEYAMIAKDESGLYSKSSASILLKSLSPSKPPPPILSASYDKSTKKINLKAILDDKLGSKKMTIKVFYRNAENEEWKLFKTDKIEKSYQTLVEINSQWSKIFLIATITNENNKASNFSNVVNVIF